MFKILAVKFLFAILLCLVTIMPFIKPAYGAAFNNTTFKEYCVEATVQSGVYDPNDEKLSLTFKTPDKLPGIIDNQKVDLFLTKIDKLNNQVMPTTIKPNCAPFLGQVGVCTFNISFEQFKNFFSSTPQSPTKTFDKIGVIKDVDIGYGIKGLVPKGPSTISELQCFQANKNTTVNMEVKALAQAVPPQPVINPPGGPGGGAALVGAGGGALPRPSCNPSTPGDCPAGLQDIENLVANIISMVVALAFIVMLVLLITAGFKYLTSGGEPKAIQSAHQTVTWALLGILFMAIAWLILQLIAAFTDIDVAVFNIKKLCEYGGDPLKFCK